MTTSQLGILIGAVLALTWLTFGFWACVLVAFAMAIGLFIARLVEGKLDLHSVADALRGKRSSS